jgi:hypothetical protein
LFVRHGWQRKAWTSKAVWSYVKHVSHGI